MGIWDTPLSGDTSGGEYPLLPAGVYEFTVKSATGAEYKPAPGKKLGHCAQIKLVLTFEGKSTKGKEILVDIYDNLYSDPSVQWKMAAFAKSTAIWHDAMTPWDVTQRAPGMTGRAALRIGEYNGRKRNEVARYLFEEKDEPEETEVEVTNDDLPF